MIDVHNDPDEGAPLAGGYWDSEDVPAPDINREHFTREALASLYMRAIESLKDERSLIAEAKDWLAGSDRTTPHALIERLSAAASNTESGTVLMDTAALAWRGLAVCSGYRPQAHERHAVASAMSTIAWTRARTAANTEAARGKTEAKTVQARGGQAEARAKREEYERWMLF